MNKNNSLETTKCAKCSKWIRIRDKNGGDESPKTEDVSPINDDIMQGNTYFPSEY